MHQARESSLVLSVAGPGADGPETRDVLGIGPRRGIDLVETSIRYRQRRVPPRRARFELTISSAQVGAERGIVSFGDREIYTGLMIQLRLSVLAQASHHQWVTMIQREPADSAFCA
jgi:hypothetical protein